MRQWKRKTWALMSQVTYNPDYSAVCKEASKVTSVLRMIKGNFQRIDIEDFRILYKTYVRPYMEYCI